MKNYIELSEIDLTQTTGVEGKIRKLIIENISHRKEVIGTIEKNKTYIKDYNSLRASYRGYSRTYEKKVYKYLYNINTLSKWFKKNQTIMFNRKEVDISSYSDLFILKLGELK